MKKIAFFALLIFTNVACNNAATDKNKQQADEPKVYLKLGDSIVKITFDTLRNVLLKTIAEKGHADAVKFCNVQALPITATYAAEGIKISRVSDRNRNPVNALQDLDKTQWEKYLALAAKKDSLKGVVISGDKEVNYYKPILMQPLCLSCHGSNEKDIAKELQPVIDSLYPADKARGYKAGELRGMWHIAFTKQTAAKK
ncbi:MAG: DUF3365 domain-containing protein [Ferruginibacter sp.]